MSCGCWSFCAFFCLWVCRAHPPSFWSSPCPPLWQNQPLLPSNPRPLLLFLRQPRTFLLSNPGHLLLFLRVTRTGPPSFPGCGEQEPF